ncbi:MAG: hypothetical protein M3458_01415 [Acidobacteriota bacterium]|nr:hypothetical protein [Acidobacteriota bacterium]
MDWMNQIGSMLQQYGGAQANQAPNTVDNDFDQFAQAAPRSAMSDGLAEAFRSDQTPPFPNMLSQLFGQSSGTQRAGILNTLMGALGPTIMSQVLSRVGGGGGAGLAGLLGGGQSEVTPEQAEQISPEAIQQIAAEAEQKDPSIIDRVSDFYSEQPALVKTLGAAALTVALAKIAQRQYGR